MPSHATARRTLRRSLFPVRLAGFRLEAGGERLALVAVGILAGSAALAAVLGGRLVMQDKALARATAGLSAESRSVQVAWFGEFGGRWSALDRQVVSHLDRLSGNPPARAMLYRESQIDGRLINLRAANDLGPYVRLTSGRLPSPCVPTHCEVVQIAGEGPVPSTPRLRLIQVGVGTLDPTAPFAAFIHPVQNAQLAQAVRYHTPQPSPVLLANGVEGLSQTTELATFFRSYAWFAPLRAGDVHPWSVGPYARAVARLRAELTTVSDRYEVTAPTDQLTSAVAASRVAASRLLLLGGETAALLLAFTILAASALRRDAAAARDRLLWAGARRWQVELSTFAETAGVAVAATVSGWALGAAATYAIARSAGSPGIAMVEHGVVSTSGVEVAALAAAASALLLYGAVRARPVQLGRLAVTPLDVAALAAAGIVAAGWARGSVNPSALSQGHGTSGFVLLLPALVTFAAAILAARLLVPTLRALGRLGRRGPLPLRLASLSLARHPGQATVAATFLVASIGLALFAAVYRSTLLTGQTDEATYAVPAPYVAAEDLSQLVPVRHMWRGPATQILRESGNVPAGVSFGFLGVPATALPATGGWRRDFASSSLSALAQAIAPTAPTALVTADLPNGKRFVLPASATGNLVGVRAFFRSELGDIVGVPLGTVRPGAPTVLSGAIPYPHAHLVSLELDIVNSGRITANAGTGLQPAARGSLRLGTPTVDGTPLPQLFASWIGTGGAAPQPDGTLRYSLTPDLIARFRPSQTTDGLPLPVLVTPGVAAAAGPDGIVPLVIEGETIPAHVAGVIQRFPSIVGEAVIADRETAAAILDTRSPGLGTTNELWAQTLRGPAPSTLTVTTRASVLADLRSDPLARGALLTLAATSLLALALALVGLLLGVVADQRDDQGELFDLEAQGASPATLRTHLRLRALLVALFGVIGGIATGAVLSALVLSLVTVTASSAAPEPPLRLMFDPTLLVAAALGYVVLAVLLVISATTFANRNPSRAAEAAA